VLVVVPVPRWERSGPADQASTVVDESSVAVRRRKLSLAGCLSCQMTRLSAATVSGDRHTPVVTA